MTLNPENKLPKLPETSELLKTPEAGEGKKLVLFDGDGYAVKEISYAEFKEKKYEDEDAFLLEAAGGYKKEDLESLKDKRGYKLYWEEADFDMEKWNAKVDKDEEVYNKLEEDRRQEEEARKRGHSWPYVDV